MSKLSDAVVGKKYSIQKIQGPTQTTERLLELGFCKGETVEVFQRSLFGDPLVIKVRQTRVALRKNEAECIEIL